MGSPIGFSGGGATRMAEGRKDESSGHGRGVQAWRWWLLGSRLEAPWIVVWILVLRLALVKGKVHGLRSDLVVVVLEIDGCGLVA
ncbi:hypothetical protein M0R45_036130 [Rubus argutus]|uniref:Uncharacterized protein n=1 Tax=Rubus argutus TaxID=59490 RepID=A0AAW1VZC8_RUBAR